MVPDSFDGTWAQTPGGVGRMLRALRARARLSQRTMAGFAGLSKTTYGAAETGERELTVSAFARAVGALGWVVELRSPDGSRLVAEPKDGPRDSRGRRLPAHVEVFRVDAFGRNWWGATRWVDPDRRAPTWTYDVADHRAEWRRQIEAWLATKEPGRRSRPPRRPSSAADDDD